MEQNWLKTGCRVWPIYKSLCSGQALGNFLELVPGQRSRVLMSISPCPAAFHSSVLPHLLFNSCLASGEKAMLKLCLFAGKAGSLAPQTPRRLEVKAGILVLLFLFITPSSCLILLKLRYQYSLGCSFRVPGAQNCPCNQATLITFKLVWLPGKKQTSTLFCFLHHWQKALLLPGNSWVHIPLGRRQWWAHCWCGPAHPSPSQSLTCVTERAVSLALSQVWEAAGWVNAFSRIMNSCLPVGIEASIRGPWGRQVPWIMHFYWPRWTSLAFPSSCGVLGPVVWKMALEEERGDAWRMGYKKHQQCHLM